MSGSGVVLRLAVFCSLLGSFTVDAQVPAYPKVIIDTVEIDDATHLPDAVRERIIASLKGREFEGISLWRPDQTSAPPGVLWDGKLADAIGEVLPNQTERDATPVYQVIRRDSSGGVHISVSIEVTKKPGMGHLTSIRFVNASDPAAPTLFPSDELRKLFPLRDGEIMSVEAMRKGLEAMKSSYASKGYIDEVINVKSEYSVETQTMSFVMGSSDGPRYRLRNIQVVGLDPTLEGILRSKLKPGDVMNFQVIRDFYKDNKSVMPTDASPQDVKLTRDPENGMVDLSFDFRALPR